MPTHTEPAILKARCASKPLSYGVGLFYKNTTHEITKSAVIGQQNVCRLIQQISIRQLKPSENTYPSAHKREYKQAYDNIWRD